MISTIVFVAIGKPRQLLLLAGMVNGLILPLALAALLVASTKTRLMNGYRHPRWMQAAGWIVVIVMGWMGCVAIADWMAK
jgi:Mn2+/Fe2+ NRAMP family transporter